MGTLEYVLDMKVCETGAVVSTLGKVSKGAKCNVVGCTQTAVRSVSPDSAVQAKMDIGGARRAYLCRAHYREMKKRLRKDRQIERWRFMG
ncbi:hypothetical protein [[Eubacterium] cellulosolvens]